MKLYSTQSPTHFVSLKEAVFKGLPDDNGLFMPQHIPVLDKGFFETIQENTLQEIAFNVAKALLDGEVPDKDLKEIIESAISFDAPLVNIQNHTYSLELFHGPTLAFKDFGARFMARLMAWYMQFDNRETHILVATSGDTGSAVASGFFGVPGIQVTILYPSGKVSEIQEKQLTTMGQNVQALEINGTFDDCQKLVKTAFLDKTLTSKINLSSANSINISRLIPQSFYYFYAYAQAVKHQLPIVFSVPSGNFGNLCAGLIAKRMGLPVHKFIAATNANLVFPEYMKTGRFVPRTSVQTIANAMDVGNPSNFARIMDLYKNDRVAVSQDIAAYGYDDATILNAMKEVYDNSDYLMCPHTATGYLAYQQYKSENKNTETLGIVLSTAHPAKFLDVVQKVTVEPIGIPEKLKTVIERNKHSIRLSADYEDLKDYLLS